MNRLRLLVMLAATLAAPLAFAADVIAPNANLKAEGIPPIPAALAAKLDPYGEFKPASAVDWHPEKRELIVARRAGNVTQLHLVSAPGDEPKQLTTFPDPVRFGTFLAKKPDALVFSRDSKGNEQRQVYRLDSPTATPVLLTDERRKNDIENFTHARDRMLVATTDVDATGKRDDPNTDLTLLDPLEPAKARKIATLPGTGWGNFSFSFDDKRVAFIQFKSVNETYVWVMDLATGDRKRVFPAEGATARGPIATFNVNFARDGKGLFLSTDRDGEFQKLAYFDLGSGKLEYFGEGGDWDVESIGLSPDGHTLAVIANEAGIGVLRLYDADTRRALPKPPLPVGTVGGAVWHQNSRDLAVTVSSAQSPSDVYAIDTRDEPRRALDRDQGAWPRCGELPRRRADLVEELRRAHDQRLPDAAAGALHAASVR